MRVMIAGAGSVGRSIAGELVKSGHEVVLVDSDPNAMRIASVPEADWVLADACEISNLRQMELDTVDVVVGATGDDKVNLVLSLLAKTEFGVPRVIARVNNPANSWLFEESWGVDVPVSTPRIMTSLIEDAVTAGTLVRRLEFYQSGASMYQATVARKAPLVGTVVADIALPPDIVLCALIRDDVPLAVSPDTLIDAGDQLLFIAGARSQSNLSEVEALISPVDPAP